MPTAEDDFIGELYDRYFDNVCKLCLYRLNDPCEAKDCAQDVFCIALVNKNKLVAHADPEKWLYKTAHNLIKQRLRRRKRSARHEAPISLCHETPDSHDPYEPCLFTDEEIETFKLKIVSSLTEKERSLYELRYVKRLSLGEISRLCGVSEHAVRLRVYRLNIKLNELKENIFS